MDQIFGGNGDDKVAGQGDNDKIYRSVGIDELFGNDGDDKIFAGSGDDLLEGDIGNDQLFGGVDIDYLFGGEDNYNYHQGENKSCESFTFFTHLEGVRVVPPVTTIASGVASFRFNTTGNELLKFRITVKNLDLDGNQTTEYYITEAEDLMKQSKLELVVLNIGYAEGLIDAKRFLKCVNV